MVGLQTKAIAKRVDLKRDIGLTEFVSQPRSGKVFSALCEVTPIFKATKWLV